MAFNLGQSDNQSPIRSVIPQSGLPRPQNCETRDHPDAHQKGLGTARSATK
jgi:hypothetical protein